MADNIIGRAVGAAAVRHGELTKLTVYLDNNRTVELQLKETVRLMLLGELDLPAA